MAKSMQQGVNKKKVPNSVAAAKKTACEEVQDGLHHFVCLFIYFTGRSRKKRS